MKKIVNEEQGVVAIIEATIVFPIMFFVIFMLLFMGNIYYQQARLNAVVDVAAVKGAALCADPMLDDIISKGEVPTSNNDIQPYRYIFGVSDIETKIQGEVTDEYNSIGDGFFASMSPLSASINCDAKFNNNIIAYSFTVQATYDIKVPIRFLGAKAPTIVSLSAKATAPVNDNAEFINNLDMAIDYYESSGLKEKVDKATKKIKGFFDTFGSK